MSSCENVQSTEVGNQGHQNHPPVVSDGHPILNDSVKEAVEEEVEDEEEDVDFNPFLKETPSPEASSSLSSEIEGLDTDVDSRANTRVIIDVTSSKIKTKVKNCDFVDVEHGEEEIVMQSTASPELQNTVPRKHNSRKPGSSSAAETEKETQLSNVKVGDSDNATHSLKPIMHLDDAEDDAICRRTRARYSLAGFSLDELEAFLQETDDEDDVQNVDDEEEYRKFLSAVLQGGDGDTQSTQENENGDDEDEENDADFEIELEEALESDYDEATLEKTRAEEYQRAVRRPETRQNRRLKASAQYERKLSDQTKRPLRPLLPIMSNGVIPITTVSGKTWIPEAYKSSLPSAAVDGFINGFTPYQIGQLHCLIYEHVQLLIQIYSLCVLDHSRQPVAGQIQGFVFELLHKREEAIACKTKPYPDTCFKPPYFSASVPNTQMVGAQKISSPTGSNADFSNGQLFSSWVPVSGSSVLSVLDVAPLNLVGKYMEDVYSAVQEHRQRHLEHGCATQDEKEPLFPSPCVPSAMEANNEALRGSAPPTSYTLPSSISQPLPKKTLAATLVEKTKKQSVAVVPKEISKLAQRFFPLFNPALFPHKPPPASVANRVLFTDAEDELLALGIMEYNSDWKAIHQRFLPCKSKHQIFVRQKNRCSSKAPENPIKAVRRMKTSPLTAEEIQVIQEGLKVFKLDWMSVWKFIVPHRDPSLLPRQWRIALGTQKSYKLNEVKKEKRRLYESERRKRKAADLTNQQHASDKEGYRAEYTGGQNCSGDDDINNVDESYVHEGFLADWRPGTSKLTLSEHPCSNIRDKNLSENALRKEGVHVRDQSNSYVSTVIKPLTGHMQGSPHSLNHSQHAYTSHVASNALKPTHPVPSVALNSSRAQVHLRPYRSRKSSNLRVVKLAPDLPPVNLPPSVRIISESALNNRQHRAYTKISPIFHSTKPLNNKRDNGNPTRENVTNWCSEESRVVNDKSAAEERSAQIDLQMHPLLLQAPEDGQVPYYQLNSGAGASSSFSFFTGTGSQPQLNLSLFYNPQQTKHAIDGLTESLKVKESVSASCGIDFHPLLQRDDDTNSELVTANSTASHTISLDGKSAAPGGSSTAVQIKSVVHCSPLATRLKPSSPKEKANELDLEIHLSSSSTKENAALCTNMTPHATNLSVGLLNSKNATEIQDTPHLSSNKFASGVSASSIDRYMDDASDQSYLEIVMEQEELSDSDEEVEEHVEFECEEMADSEGEEGSDSEQLSEMQDKEALCSVTRKIVSDEECLDQQCDLSTHSNSRTNISVPGRGSPPFLKLGLTGSKKDTSRSWLSLDSSATGPTSRSKSKNEARTMSKGPAAKILALDHPNRSLKQATTSTRKVSVEEHAIDMAGQLSLGPLSVPTLGRPRKRAFRTNTTANAASGLGTLKIDAKNSG